MAQQIITGGDGVDGQSGLEVRDIVNENFTELYNFRYPQYMLYGTCQNAAMNVDPQRMRNYTESAVWGYGADPDALDASFGSITIPESGIYTLNAFLTGLQGNSAKDDQMGMYANVDGVQYILSIFDVATNKTSGRSFSAVMTRYLTIGTVIYLEWQATGTMGTFDVQSVSFEIARRA